ncbi:MAG: hypothetical protein RSB88_08385, partial [Akkermansia sp.]
EAGAGAGEVGKGTVKEHQSPPSAPNHSRLKRPLPECWRVQRAMLQGGSTRAKSFVEEASTHS